MARYYTKAQVDGMFGNYYTKAQVDTMFASTRLEMESIKETCISPLADVKLCYDTYSLAVAAILFLRDGRNICVPYTQNHYGNIH